MEEYWSKIIAIEDHTGCIYNKEGINVYELIEYNKINKSIKKFLEGRVTWSFEDVQRRQKETMTKASEEIWDIMKEYYADMRTATYMKLIRKIESVMKLRWI